MYIEFIVIYVLLIAVVALTIVNLILIKKLLGNNDTISSITNSQPVSNYSVSPVNAQQSSGDFSNVNTAVDGDRVVFCTRCAAQYPASSKICPNCGAQR